MNKNRHLVVNSFGEPNGNGTEHDDMILGDRFLYHPSDPEHLQQQSCNYLHEEESSG